MNVNPQMLQMVITVMTRMSVASIVSDLKFSFVKTKFFVKQSSESDNVKHRL